MGALLAPAGQRSPPSHPVRTLGLFPAPHAALVGGAGERSCRGDPLRPRAGKGCGCERWQWRQGTECSRRRTRLYAPRLH